MGAANSQFHIYYSNLTNVQRAVYSELLPEIDKACKKIPVQTKCTSDDVFKAVAAIMNDHPELFWMTGSTHTWTQNNVVTSVEVKHNALADRLGHHRKQFQKAVDSYKKLVSGKPTLEQIRLVHDKMVRDVSYVSGSFDQTSCSPWFKTNLFAQGIRGDSNI